MLKFVMVLTGTVIGGGFASGREIGTYFLKYGEYAFLGMIVFAFLFFVLCFRISFICKKENIFTADEFFKYVFGKDNGDAVYFFVAAFSFSVLCSMLSAMTELITYFWEKGEFYLRIIISLLLCLVLSKGFVGVECVNKVLVPFLVAGILMTGITENKNSCFDVIVYEESMAEAFVSSIIYTCYNIITVIPAVVGLSEENSLKTNAVSCILSAAVLFVCAVSVGSIIMPDFESNMSFSIPVIRAVSSSGGKKYITIFFVIISMATTAVSSACWVKDYINEKTGKSHCVLLSGIAFVLSFLPFAVFVDKMYFIFGAAASFGAYKILKP